MTTSLKQSLANRLNSLRSTGPRSASGKAIASTNSTKHGLSRIGTIPPAEMAAAIAARMVQWRDAYRPQGAAQDWTFERLCAESVRLDACERRLIAARVEAAARAAESWDDDRAAEVATLASKFPDHPERIQPKLLTSRHGVLWMLERWEVVAESLRRHDGWTIDNWMLALDLLGVPVEGRRTSGPWDLNPEDKTAAPGLDLVGQGVEALRARLGSHLDVRDARRRADAEAGLGDASPEVRRFERYAADARRQVARCTAELRRLQAEAAGRRPAPAPSGPPGPRPVRTPRSTPAPAPAPRTAPEPSPRNAPEPVSAPPSADLPPSPATMPVSTSMARPTAPLSASLRDRLAPRNRRERRAMAAAARRG